MAIDKEILPENLSTTIGDRNLSYPNEDLETLATQNGQTIIPAGRFLFAWGDLNAVPGLKESLPIGNFNPNSNQSINCEFDIMCNTSMLDGTYVYLFDYFGAYEDNIGNKPPTHARLPINDVNIGANTPTNQYQSLYPVIYDIPGFEENTVMLPENNYWSGTPLYSFAQAFSEYADDMDYTINPTNNEYTFTHDFHNHYGSWQENLDNGPHAPVSMKQSMWQFYWPGDTVEDWENVSNNKSLGVGLVLSTTGIISDNNNEYPSYALEGVDNYTPQLSNKITYEDHCPLCIDPYLVAYIGYLPNTDTNDTNGGVPVTQAMFDILDGNPIVATIQLNQASQWNSIETGVGSGDTTQWPGKVSKFKYNSLITNMIFPRNPSVPEPLTPNPTDLNQYDTRSFETQPWDGTPFLRGDCQGKGYIDISTARFMKALGIYYERFVKNEEISPVLGMGYWIGRYLGYGPGLSMDNIEYLRCNGQADPNLSGWAVPFSPEVGEPHVGSGQSFYDYPFSGTNYITLFEDTQNAGIATNQAQGGGPFFNTFEQSNIFQLGECIGAETIECPISKASVCVETRYGPSMYYNNCPYPQEKFAPEQALCGDTHACNWAGEDAAEIFIDNSSCVYPNMYCQDTDLSGACDILGGTAENPETLTYLYCPVPNNYGYNPSFELPLTSGNELFVKNCPSDWYLDDCGEIPGNVYDDVIIGCSDSDAMNYNPNADFEGECQYCPDNYIDLEDVLQYMSDSLLLYCSFGTLSQDTNPDEWFMPEAGICGRCLHQDDYSFLESLYINHNINIGGGASIPSPTALISWSATSLTTPVGDIVWVDNVGNSLISATWENNFEMVFVKNSEEGFEDTSIKYNAFANRGRLGRIRTIASSLNSLKLQFYGQEPYQEVPLGNLQRIKTLYLGDNVMSPNLENGIYKYAEAETTTSTTSFHIPDSLRNYYVGSQDGLTGKLPSFSPTNDNPQLRRITITGNPGIGNNNQYGAASTLNNFLDQLNNYSLGSSLLHFNLSNNGLVGYVSDNICPIYTLGNNFNITNNNLCLSPDIIQISGPACLAGGEESWLPQNNVDDCPLSCPTGYSAYDLSETLYDGDWNGTNYNSNKTGLHLFSSTNGNPSESGTGDYCLWDEDVAVLQSMVDTSAVYGPQMFDEDPSIQHYIPANLNPLRLGKQKWTQGTALTENPANSEEGYRLTQFSMLDPVEKKLADGTWTDDLYTLAGPLPDNIGNWTLLVSLKLGSDENTDARFKQYLTGTLPESFYRINTLFGEAMVGPSYLQIANMELSGQISEEFCDWNGTLFSISGNDFADQSSLIQLQNNNFCPPYPSCITPAGEFPYYDESNSPFFSWYLNNLEYLTLDEYNQPTMGGTTTPQNSLDCPIPGCTAPEALNFNVIATEDDGSCEFDSFLHFPWELYSDGPRVVFIEGFGNITKVGDYGASLSILDMIEILHAPSGCGFNNTCQTINIPDQYDESDQPVQLSAGYQYNSYSDLKWDDAESGMITIDDGLNMIGGVDEFGLPYGFTDQQFNALAGINYGQNNYCKPRSTSPQGVVCSGDARPYEFIKRVYEEIDIYGSSAYQFIETYFPTYGANVSMFGIDYFEDYDLDFDGNLSTQDQESWHKSGRHDISVLINQMLLGEINVPNNMPISDDSGGNFAPDINVNLGYMKEFYSENISVEGMETPDGEQVTIPVYEGFEQFTRSKLNEKNYFTNNTSATIEGTDIHTSSMDDSNKKYFFGITDGDPDSSKSNTQFYVTFGHSEGSGSNTYNDTIKGESEAIYKQYSSTLLPQREASLGFFISSGSESEQSLKQKLTDSGVEATKDKFIYVLNFKHSNFGDQLQPGTWTLNVSASNAGVGKTISLTDDSAATFGKTLNGIGRVYNIISGSDGNVVESIIGSTATNRYGLFYPDMGIMVLGERLANAFVSVQQPIAGKFNSSGYTLLAGSLTSTNGSNQIVGVSTEFFNDLNNGDDIQIKSGSGDALVTQRFTIANISSSTSMSISANWTATTFSGSFVFKNDGYNQLYPYLSSSIDGKNALRFANALKNNSVVSSLILKSEKETVDKYYACRVLPGEFNFTNNPTIISSSTRNMISPTPNLLNEFISGSGGNNPVGTMTGNPNTYISRVDLIDKQGRCVATATLSNPIQNNFEKEVVIKVKLSL